MAGVEWRCRDGHVWLGATAGCGIALEDVVRQADTAGYRELDVAAVVAVLTDGEDRPVARPSGRARPGIVEVSVAPDAMTASLVVLPPAPDAPALTALDVEAALAEAGVCLGLDQLVLDALPLDRPGEYLVARGWEPEPGRDGTVAFLVPVDRELRPAPRDDGGVDFRAVATVPHVQAGQRIAVLVDPVAGTPGRTVVGGVIDAPPGEPARLPKGPNVKVSDDGRDLFAAIDGLLEVTGDRVVVRPDLVVPGDVDFESGSIDFPGDVVVFGSVRSGFRASAGGRLVVYGDVENAVLEATELVWVRGAVVGPRSLVRCTGDVKVRTVHEARVEARGCVYIEREAADAVVLAGLDLLLERPRNRLSGGTARAGRDVVAAEIGTLGEAPTRVCVGVDPFAAEAVEAINEELGQYARALTRVKAAVAPFHVDPDRLRQLSPERRASVDRLLSAEAALRTKLAELTERLRELEHPSAPDRPQVVARYALRPNVVLEITGTSFRVDTSQFRVAATLDHGEVTFGPVLDQRQRRHAS